MNTQYYKAKIVDLMQPDNQLLHSPYEAHFLIPTTASVPSSSMFLTSISSVNMPPPDHLFGDPERSQLIEQIWDRIKEYPTAHKVTFRTVWACLWLSDIKMLRKMAENDDGQTMLGLLEMVEGRNIVKKWMQQDRDPHSKTPSAVSTPTRASRSEGGNFGEENNDNPSSSMAGSSPIAPHSLSASPSIGDVGQKINRELFDITRKTKARSTSAASMCKERDNGCIVSRATPNICEVAHMYPFSMTNQSAARVHIFWLTLRIFWTEERVNQWWRAVFGDDDGTEKPENLITLNPTAHKMHTQGYFALEPIGLDQDRKQLALCFWWLKQGNSAEKVSVSSVPDLSAAYDPQGDSLGLLNMHTYRPLRSGDVIVLVTPDPDKHPLPDIRILEMQWVMNRITAMRGTAEPKDPFEGDSEDESDSNDGDLP